MSEKSEPSDRDWREIASQAAQETNPRKLVVVIEELCTALDRRSQKQSHSYTPDTKSA